jgi:hypothetical protein
MQLLTHLQAAGATAPGRGLPDLVPRLWPFFRHTLAPVRLATVRCLAALLAGGRQHPPHEGADHGGGARPGGVAPSACDPGAAHLAAAAAGEGVDDPASRGGPGSPGDPGSRSSGAAGPVSRPGADADGAGHPGVDPAELPLAGAPAEWLGAGGVLAPALRLVFQNLVLEANARVLEASQARALPGRPRFTAGTAARLQRQDIS